MPAAEDTTVAGLPWAATVDTGEEWQRSAFTPDIPLDVPSRAFAPGRCLSAVLPSSITHRVFVGGTVIIGAPFFYPYPYYPPVYAPPPVYIEQGGGVYYYCPDYNDYYPNVSTCPSQWVPVSATANEYPQ